MRCSAAIEFGIKGQVRGCKWTSVMRMGLGRLNRHMPRNERRMRLGSDFAEQGHNCLIDIVDILDGFKSDDPCAQQSAPLAQARHDAKVKVKLPKPLRTLTFSKSDNVRQLSLWTKTKSPLLPQHLVHSYIFIAQYVKVPLRAVDV